jgi:NADH-quinone oxidoreductase subunit C
MTDLTLAALLPALESRFGPDVKVLPSRKEVLGVVQVKVDRLVEVARFLHDQGTFTHCALVSGVDWIEHIEVLYHLWSDALKGYLEITVETAPEDPHVPSVTSIWRGANWHERETWDMLGVRFDGHPDLRRVLMPEGYRFHPLRKSFELHEPEELEVKARHV